MNRHNRGLVGMGIEVGLDQIQVDGCVIAGPAGTGVGWDTCCQRKQITGVAVYQLLTILAHSTDGAARWNVGGET